MMKHGSKNSDEAMIIKEINKIKVTKPIVSGILVENPTELPVISLEEKRVVIGIDDKRCAVFYEKEEKAEKEFQALQKGAARGITPIAYGRRGNYVVMEFIQAPTIADYLKNNPLTKDMTKRLLALLDDLKIAGFTRIDQDPAYIYLMPDGNFKVQNLHRHLKLPAKSFPQRMIKGMGKHVITFLQYVKELQPDMYKTWSQHPKFNAVIAKAKSAGQQSEAVENNESSHD
jgi:RIO-like serine/threonine protein kinase